MAFVATKSKFHVALNGVGLILQGAPERPAYIQQQAPTYGQRFASGDRTYNDLSKWWYFVQTDWSGGFKDTVAWADDSKYYLSSNIDAWSEPGAIKLTRAHVLLSTITESVFCGVEGTVNNTLGKFIGTDDAASGKPIVYQYAGGGTWTDISSVSITTNQNIISQISTRNNYLMVSTVGAGTTWVVAQWSGAAWTDQSANIGGGAGAPFAWQLSGSRCHITIGSKFYIFVENGLNHEWGLASCTKDLPAAGADWTKVLERLNTSEQPIDCCEFQGNLYYLLVGNNNTTMELRVYNIATAADVSVRVFRNANPLNFAMGTKLLHNYLGKLIVTIPEKEIWSYDGNTLSRIFKRDDAKSNLGNAALGFNIYPFLTYGGVISDNKIWWGNLMYDGESFFYWNRSITDDGSDFVIPLFVDSLETIYSSYTGNQKKIYTYSHQGAVYKGAAGNNYMLLNNFDSLSGIDKMLYSLTILFKPLAANQKILIEYFVGDLTSTSTFTALGNVSNAVDGGVITDKKFFFPVGTIFKKLWVKIKLEGDTTNTPTLTDILAEYLPIPSPTKTWSLNINCGDEVKRLDGRLVETTGRELRDMLEIAWWTKSILDFQDLDYATTLINDGANITISATSIIVDDTKDFPEQGRLKIDDEEMFYTGKTPTSFTGLTRGARDTKAATHLDNAVVNNAYKVIMTDLTARVPVALKDKQLEYVTGLTIREV